MTRAGAVGGAVHPYLDVPHPFVLAHRGFSPDGLENSMPAFAAAVDLGVTHLETDVHATRDGVLVAFHDFRLDRVTDMSGWVARLPWSQVSRARIGGVEPIPLLEDVLGTWPHVRFNIDVKEWPAVRPFADVVRRTGSAARICVASFSDRRRRRALRALLDPGAPSPTPPEGAAAIALDGPSSALPAWSLGIAGSTAVVLAARLAARPRAVRPGAAVLRRALGGAVALQIPPQVGAMHVVDRSLVDAVHAAGAEVHVWTVDDPTAMRRLLDAGVDALVTNRTDLALDAVRRHRGPSTERQAQ